MTSSSQAETPIASGKTFLVLSGSSESFDNVGCVLWNRRSGGSSWYTPIMDYELAKQLKDAGFPQITTHSFYDKYGGIIFGRTNLELEPDAQGWEWICAAPSLEELIEACVSYIGIGFELRLGNYGQGKWKAASHGAVKRAESGATPTDAVARLYLALHPTAPSQSQ